MAGLLSAIGGAIAGVGQGLTAQAEEDGKAKREARLLELQNQYAMVRQKDSQAFQSSERVAGQEYQTTRDATKFGQEKEMAGIKHGYDLDLEGRRAGNNQANTRLSDELATKRADTAYGREKEMAGIKHGYDVENENVRSGNRIKEERAKVEARGSDGDLTPADQRELNLARQSNTNPITKQVDWLATYRQLKGNGRDDLAQRLVASEGGAVSDAIRKEAQRRAEAEAGERSGWFSTDSSDFKDDGGSRDAFIKRRTAELVQQELGGGSGRASGNGSASSGAASAGQPSPTPSAPSSQGASPPASKPPAGKGTQAEPFQATSQADIEWFKSAAPKGAVIVVNGKPFTK